MAKIDEDKSYYAPQHDLDWDALPLHSEILPGLWLGGTADWDTIDIPVVDINDDREITTEKFDAVVTLYAWAQPVDWHVQEYRYGFYDSNEIGIDHTALGMMIDFAEHHWKAGKKVLIRCQAGINRSSFVMAFLLMRQGFTAEEAIALMREKRSSYVLMNQAFEDFLLGLDERKEPSIES